MNKPTDTNSFDLPPKDFGEQQPKKSNPWPWVIGCGCVSVLAAGVLIAIVLAMAIPAIRHGQVAARRMVSMNNMKQIGLAMHNHNLVYKKFPEAIEYKDEDVLWSSWRVRLLPFTEQVALHDQFNLEEPWDSPANMQVAEIMPAPYLHPELQLPLDTVYLLPTGESQMFSQPTVRLASIVDGTANTIMTIEANAANAVHWTKPQDLDVDLNNPFAGVADFRTDGTFLVGLADGSVRALPDTLDAQTMKALLTFDAEDDQALLNWP